MKQGYDNAVSIFDAHAANPFIPLVLELDLRTLSQLTFAIETLERIVFEKCSLGHRGLAALVSVKDATDDLKISRRPERRQRRSTSISGLMPMAASI
jgi:hypothetical protein